MDTFIDYFLHADKHLEQFATAYGPWIYAILFAIVFAETGLVVTPILPGDSLLFATGALAGIGVLNVWYVLPLLTAAAILGDAVNYAAGHYVGPKVFTAEARDTLFHRLLNRDHLNKAHAFFEKYGAMAIISGRFVPIVRTFVPFVAGAGAMRYPTFALCNVGGAILWVGVCVLAGVAFGNVPFVKNNFSLVTLGIIAVSLLPIVVAYVRDKAKTRQERIPG